MRAGPGLLKSHIYKTTVDVKVLKTLILSQSKKRLTHLGPKRKTMAFNEKLVKWLMASIKEFCISTNSL